MKTLILTSKTGEGHNSCAEAILEAMEEKGLDAEESETLGLIFKDLPDWMSGLHTGVYRSLPSLFKDWYRFMERPGVYIRKIGSARYFLKKGAEQLYGIVTENGYDTIVCTHVIAALIVTDMLEQHKMNVRTYFVSTDYTCHPGVRECGLDHFLIPDASLTEMYVSHGIPREKIAVSGIPVRKAFYAHTDRREAKAAFGVDPEHKHLVVMCGSMGCGPMGLLAEFFARKLPPSQEATIVCGTNRRLYDSLRSRYAGNVQLHIAGYVKDVSLLMDSADLYFTKPGGLSLSEACAKGLPMVLLNVVAGCEDYNLEYFTKLGAAVTAGTLRGNAKLCLALLADGRRREKMAAAFAKGPVLNAANEVRDFILADRADETAVTAPSEE